MTKNEFKYCIHKCKCNSYSCNEAQNNGQEQFLITTLTHRRTTEEPKQNYIQHYARLDKEPRKLRA